MRRIGRVDDVKQERRLERLVEGGPERRDQVVRQLLDEAHGVETRTRGLVSGWRARTVVSSVAKSLSSTSTALPVRARISDDLPAFV